MAVGLAIKLFLENLEMSFSAKYAGTCTWCRNGFSVGDQIAKGKRGWVHGNCDPVVERVSKAYIQGRSEAKPRKKTKRRRAKQREKLELAKDRLSGVPGVWSLQDGRSKGSRSS